MEHRGEYRVEFETAIFEGDWDDPVYTMKIIFRDNTEGYSVGSCHEASTDDATYLDIDWHPHEDDQIDAIHVHGFDRIIKAFDAYRAALKPEDIEHLTDEQPPQLIIPAPAIPS